MEEAVEQRGDGGGVAEQLAPALVGSVRGEQRGGRLVAAHDQFEQVLGGGVRQLGRAEVVYDEQGHAGQVGQIVLAGFGERRLGELFEEGVRLAVDDAIALLDRGAADSLGEMALARTGRPEQERVFALGDEAGGGELEDERAVDLLVEGEVEAVEGAVGVAEAGLLVSPGEQAVLVPLEFVSDERVCPARSTSCCGRRTTPIWPRTCGWGSIYGATSCRRGNLVAHCIPHGMEGAEVGDYGGFLKERRLLMAGKIRDYYRAL